MDRKEQSQQITAPLAGRPPFATDEDDAVYKAGLPTQKLARPKLPAANRDSAYNHYDHYLSDSQDNNRVSTISMGDGGTAGIGMGLMNDMDDDSDSDGEFEMVSTPVPEGSKPPAYRQNSSGSNTAAAEAARPEKSPSATASIQYPSPAKTRAPVGGTLPSTPAPPAPPAPASLTSIPDTPTSSYPPSPAPAPVSLPSSPAVTVNVTRSPIAAPVAQYAPGNPSRPMPAFMRPSAPSSPAPSFATGPVDLPTASPINPKMAAPSPSVAFVEKEHMAIMRGDSEETLLARSTVGSRPARGGGDDFWRRFSMVARKEEEKRKSVDWLQKQQSRGSRFRGLMWFCGFVVLCLVGGGVALAWFLTHNRPAHSIPVAVGGRGNQGFDPSTTDGAGFAPAPAPTATTRAPKPSSTSTSTTKHSTRGVVEDYVRGLPINVTAQRRGWHRVNFKARTKPHHFNP